LQVRGEEPPPAGGLLRAHEGAPVPGPDRSAGPRRPDPRPAGPGRPATRVERQDPRGGVQDEGGHRVVRLRLPGAGRDRRSAPPAGEGGGEPAGRDSAAAGVPGEEVRLGALVGAAHQPFGEHLPELASRGALSPRGGPEVVRGASGERHQPGGVVRRRRRAPAGAPRPHPAGDGGGPGEEGQRPRGGGGVGEAAGRLRRARRQPPQGVGGRVELPRRLPLLGEAQERGAVRPLGVDGGAVWERHRAA